MSWKPEVIADNSGKWNSNGLRFATKAEAELYVRDLAGRWTSVREWRVVECDDTVTHVWAHKSITVARIMQACERQRMTLDNPGLCIACGNEQEGCEPDARKYECEACGEKSVYGAEELLLRVLP